MFRTIRIRSRRTDELVQTVSVFVLYADLNASRSIAAFSTRVGGMLDVS